VRRRFFRIAGFAVVTLLALPGAAAGQTSGQDSVVGTAFGPFTGPTFPIRTGYSFDLRSGPSGENLSGSLLFRIESRFGEQVFPTRLTCLNQTGNRATVGGQLVNFTVPEVSGLLLFVEDNPGIGEDQVTVGAFGPEPPSACPPSPPVMSDITGDIAIHDALTRPQAKAACKAEREEIGRRAFRARYGTPGRALRNCINLKRE
jgi:hypothetical protein